MLPICPWDASSCLSNLTPGELCLPSCGDNTSAVGFLACLAGGAGLARLEGAARCQDVKAGAAANVSVDHVWAVVQMWCELDEAEEVGADMVAEALASAFRLDVGLVLSVNVTVAAARRRLTDEGDSGSDSLPTTWHFDVSYEVAAPSSMTGGELQSMAANLTILGTDQFARFQDFLREAHAVDVTLLLDLIGPRLYAIFGPLGSEASAGELPLALDEGAPAVASTASASLAGILLGTAVAVALVCAVACHCTRKELARGKSCLAQGSAVVAQKEILELKEDRLDSSAARPGGMLLADDRALEASRRLAADLLAQAPAAFSFTVYGVDFEALMAEGALRTAFEAHVKAAFAGEVGRGVLASDVHLSLSPDSVIVGVAVSPPESADAESLQACLHHSPSLLDSLQRRLRHLDGMENACTGCIEVSPIEALLPDRSAVTDHVSINLSAQGHPLGQQPRDDGLPPSRALAADAGGFSFVDDCDAVEAPKPTCRPRSWALPPALPPAAHPLAALPAPVQPIVATAACDHTSGQPPLVCMPMPDLPMLTGQEASVKLSFVALGLDAHALAVAPWLRLALEMAAKVAVALEAGNGTQPEDVTFHLAPQGDGQRYDAVLAMAAVTAPSGSLASALLVRLRLSITLTERLRQALQEVVGIETISNAPIEVTDIKVSLPCLRLPPHMPPRPLPLLAPPEDKTGDAPMEHFNERRSICRESTPYCQAAGVSPDLEFPCSEPSASFPTSACSHDNGGSSVGNADGGTADGHAAAAASAAWAEALESPGEVVAQPCRRLRSPICTDPLRRRSPYGDGLLHQHHNVGGRGGGNGSGAHGHGPSRGRGSWSSPDGGVGGAGTGPRQLHLPPLNVSWDIPRRPFQPGHDPQGPLQYECRLECL